MRSSGLVAPFALLVTLACAGNRGGSAPVHVARADIASAARPRTLPPSMRGDGTPLGDSLALIAESAWWELEGGDWQRGDRLFRYAVSRGWPIDRTVPRNDLLELLRMTPDPAEWLRVIDAVATRPGAPSWLPEARARLAQRLQATSPAPR